MITVKFYRFVDKISKLKKSKSLRKKLFNTAKRNTLWVIQNDENDFSNFDEIDVSAKTIWHVLGNADLNGRAKVQKHVVFTKICETKINKIGSHDRERI